jgi:hypothetical protein
MSFGAGSSISFPRGREGGKEGGKEGGRREEDRTGLVQRPSPAFDLKRLPFPPTYFPPSLPPALVPHPTGQLRDHLGRG